MNLRKDHYRFSPARGRTPGPQPPGEERKPRNFAEGRRGSQGPAPARSETSARRFGPGDGLRAGPGLRRRVGLAGRVRRRRRPSRWYRRPAGRHRTSRPRSPDGAPRQRFGRPPAGAPEGETSLPLPGSGTHLRGAGGVRRRRATVAAGLRGARSRAPVRAACGPPHNLRGPLGPNRPRNPVYPGADRGRLARAAPPLQPRVPNLPFPSGEGAGGSMSPTPLGWVSSPPERAVERPRLFLPFGPPVSDSGKPVQTKPETRTTLSGGSLGSCVDEERS